MAQKSGRRGPLGNVASAFPNLNPQTGGPVSVDYSGTPPPDVSGTGVYGPNTGGPSTTGSGIKGGSFTGDAKDFLSSLYNARPKFIQQQGDLLSKFGPALRQSVFAASPELAQASDYLTQTFSDPFGGTRSTFEDAIRNAQAARGFTGGGTGVVGEEARYLTNFAEQRRMQLLPQLQAFGNNILGISGLSQPTDVNLASLGGLALQNKNLNATTAANQAQSDLSQKMYNDYLAQLNRSALPEPQRKGTTSTVVGSNPFGNGRSFSGQSGGGNSAGTFDASGNLVSSGNGLDFGGGIKKPPATDLAAQAKILQASGKLNTEAEYLAFIGQNNARSVTSAFNGVPI